MSGYELGFVGIMGFMVIIAAGALFFISFDAKHTPIQTDETEPEHSPLFHRDITGRYLTVHHVTTNTLETVDLSGVRRRWKVNSEG